LAGLSDKTGDSRRKKIDRILAVIALGTILIAWFSGHLWKRAHLIPSLEKTFPEISVFKPISGDTFTAWGTEPEERFKGFVATGTADGYGGELTVAVRVDSGGTLVNLGIVEHRETYSFLKRVVKNKYLGLFKGKTYNDSFTLGEDIEAVTGATYTSRAIINATKKAVRTIASKQLKLSVPPEKHRKIRFGFPEALLILLFLTGYLGRHRRIGYLRAIRWGSMLTGLIVLGFIYNLPFTLVFVNKLLLGFLPDWRIHLFWYLLLGGLLFFFIIDDKNPYCEWFCPFGAAQECFGVIGGAKARTPDRFKFLLRWVQRGLAWLAIVLALLFRNPGISGYEIFGTLFKLIGSNYQFILLGIVLVTALFIRRPWCSFLCPLRPVTDFIRLIRNWIKELWLKRKLKPVQ